jgi:hypothetical protein
VNNSFGQEASRPFKRFVFSSAKAFTFVGATVQRFEAHELKEAQVLQTVAGALIVALQKIRVTHMGAALPAGGQAKLPGRLGMFSGTARALAVGIMLTSPVTAHADKSVNAPNAVEDLFYGSDHSQRASHERVDSAWRDPFNHALSTG